MKKAFTKLYTEDGQQYKITAEVRFDDEPMLIRVS